MGNLSSSLPLGNDQSQAFLMATPDEEDNRLASARVSRSDWKKQSIAIMVGKEPTLTSQSTKAQVCDAFNWYSYSCDMSDSKKYVIAYLKTQYKKAADTLVARLNLLPDWEFGPTGWMARQINIGNELPPEYNLRFQDRLKTLNEKAKVLAERANKEVAVVAKVSVQRNVTPGASSIIAEIDERIDSLTKKSEPFDGYKFLSDRSATAPTLTDVVRYYEPYLKEANEAQNKKGNEQVLEAYSKLAKGRAKLISEFLTKFISDCEVMQSNKKRERKPRSKKVKSALQVTKHLKYKLSDDTYNIKSIQATDVPGSLQLWVFNTKTRKLGVYYADDTQALTVKGTTVMGFNPATSLQKKLRKPEKTLPDVVTGTKVSLRKIMEGINAKAQALNGRINSDTILVRSIK